MSHTGLPLGRKNSLETIDFDPVSIKFVEVSPCINVKPKG
jgi:hypothetical protein